MPLDPSTSANRSRSANSDVGIDPRTAGSNALDAGLTAPIATALDALPIQNLLFSLTELSERRHPQLSDAALNVLAGEGLVEILSPEQFATANQQQRRYDTLHAAVEASSEKLEAARNHLSEVKRSEPMFFGRAEWNDRMTSATDSEVVAQQANKLAQEALAKILAPSEPSKFVPVGVGYARLSESGRDFVENAQDQLAVLANTSAKYVIEIYRSVGEATDTFLSLRHQVVEAWTETHFAQDQFAACVSRCSGDRGALLERGEVFDSLIADTLGIDHEAALALTSRLLAERGDEARIVDQVSAVAELLCPNDDVQSLSTLLVASEIRRVSESSIESKVARYEAVLSALENDGWERDDDEVRIAAAILARTPGSPSTIASRLKEIENRIIALGYEESFETGIASVLLFNAPDREIAVQNLTML